jgi:hypothetical protein
MHRSDMGITHSDPSSVFLRDEQNRAYMENRSPDFVLQERSRMPCLMLAIIVFSAIALGLWKLVLLTLGQGNTGASGIMVIGVALFVVLTGLALRDIRRYLGRLKRLKEEGSLKLGLVNRCTESLVEDAEGDVHTELEVEYEFSSGMRLIAGIERMWCRNPVGPARPQTGTRVAVLYVDDNLWELL